MHQDRHVLSDFHRAPVNLIMSYVKILVLALHVSDCVPELTSQGFLNLNININYYNL